MSPKSALTIQAFKVLGKSNTEEAVSRLSSTLTTKEKSLLLSEAKYVTAWIYDDIKTITSKLFRIEFVLNHIQL